MPILRQAHIHRTAEHGSFSLSPRAVCNGSTVLTLSSVKRSANNTAAPEQYAVSGFYCDIMIILSCFFGRCAVKCVVSVMRVDVVYHKHPHDWFS